MEEIKSSIENIGKSFEAFKKANDERLSQLEKKGSVDPLTEEKVNKLNAEITKYSEEKSRIEARLEAIETSTAADFAIDEGKNDNKAIEYKNAFESFTRKGLESKALSSGSDPDGGYVVPTEMSNRVITRIFETSPIRQIANVQSISTDQLEILVDYNEATAGWTSETESRPETNTPQLGKKIIPVHELYAQPKATQRLLDDAAINMESWLADKVADKFRRTENAAFVSGDGAGKPRGFLTYASGTSYGQIEQVTSASTTGGEVNSDDLPKLLYSLKSEYQNNATFLMKRSTLEQVRRLKGSDGQYYFIPALSQGAADTILGKNVLQCDDMPVLATDSLSIAVGDFNEGYQIVDRIGIRVLRDPFTEKPFVKFYTTKRTGGDVANFEAIKLLKMDA